MLFSKFKIKNYEFKNRIVMAPMCMYQADTLGYANEFHLIHYGARALGGVGTIILEATAVEARGRITEKDLGIYSDDHVKCLKRISEVIKKQNVIAGIQLAHAGRKSQTNSTIVAPSSIYFPEMKKPKEMTTDDIQIVILAFKNAAYRAKVAGFDLIEIHAAHGYLINQFLSSITNKRTDIYGGSINNRIRFLDEIIDAVKEVWPKERLFAIRFSADEYAKEGNNVNDIIYIINYLKSKGIDLIDVSSGGIIPAEIKLFPGYQLEYAKQIKAKTNIPTIGGGLLTNAKQANDALIDNNLDFIYFGRELLRNPNFALYAAKDLGIDLEWPQSYKRGKL